MTSVPTGILAAVSIEETTEVLVEGTAEVLVEDITAVSIECNADVSSLVGELSIVRSVVTGSGGTSCDDSMVGGATFSSSEVEIIEIEIGGSATVEVVPLVGDGEGEGEVGPVSECAVCCGAAAINVAPIFASSVAVGSGQGEEGFPFWLLPVSPNSPNASHDGCREQSVTHAYIQPRV